MRVHTENSVYEVRQTPEGYEAVKLEDKVSGDFPGLERGYTVTGKKLRLEVGKPMVIENDGGTQRFATSAVVSIEQ